MTVALPVPDPVPDPVPGPGGAGDQMAVKVMSAEIMSFTKSHRVVPSSFDQPSKTKVAFVTVTGAVTRRGPV